MRYCGETTTKKMSYVKKQNINNTCNLKLVGNLSLLIRCDKVKLRFDRKLINVINKKLVNFQENQPDQQKIG